MISELTLLLSNSLHHSKKFVAANADGIFILNRRVTVDYSFDTLPDPDATDWNCQAVSRQVYSLIMALVLYAKLQVSQIVL